MAERTYAPFLKGTSGLPRSSFLACFADDGQRGVEPQNEGQPRRQAIRNGDAGTSKQKGSEIDRWRRLSRRRGCESRFARAARGLEVVVEVGWLVVGDGDG